eukprot:2833402-Amphidinium_carterae.4
MPSKHGGMCIQLVGCSARINVAPHSQLSQLLLRWIKKYMTCFLTSSLCWQLECCHLTLLQPTSMVRVQQATKKLREVDKNCFLLEKLPLTQLR